jgi:clan AA aspartic protease
MALTYITVKVSNPKNGKKSRKRRFLVDSGAVFSVVPTKILKSLNIKPIDKQEFILANGESVIKDIGQVNVEIFGKSRIVPCVFGDEGIFLLGATTLENFGMMLDPLRREIKPLPMVI